MARLFVRHQVEDFDRWWEGYSEAEALRSDNGVRDAGIYRSADDPNDVTVWHDFDTADAARAFIQLPELREAMQRIGVTGAPTVWVTETVS